MNKKTKRIIYLILIIGIIAICIGATYSKPTTINRGKIINCKTGTGSAIIQSEIEVEDGSTHWIKNTICQIHVDGKNQCLYEETQPILKIFTRKYKWLDNCEEENK